MAQTYYKNIEDLRYGGKCFHTQKCETKGYGYKCFTCPDYAIPITEIYQIPSPWIPCSERLPYDDDCYIVAWIPKNYPMEYKHYYAVLGFDPDEQEFIVDDVIKRYAKNYEIEFLAWMPLPEEYEGA